MRDAINDQIVARRIVMTDPADLNVLGDRVAIYMPLVPEAIVAMLACARIGAAHSVVFGGFSSEALRDRIHDAEAKVLIEIPIKAHKCGRYVIGKEGRYRAVRRLSNHTLFAEGIRLQRLRINELLEIWQMTVGKCF